MSKTKVPVVKPRKSLVKGMLAGLAGGLAGAVAMTIAERFLPHPASSEPAVEPQPPEKKIAIQTVRWGVGAAVGTAYGAIAEYYPAATSKEGVTFGMAVEALAHEGALPALSFLVKPPDAPALTRAGGITSHIVYGVATEVVRGFVRKRL